MFILPIVFLWAAAGPAWSRNVPDEVIVRFRPGTPAADARRALDDLGARERGELRGLGYKRLTLPPGLTVDAAIARLRRNPNVDVAEPNAEIRGAALPNDPKRALQWHLDRIHATDAWAAGVAGAQGAASVVIAVVDSGVAGAHDDLAPKLVPGYNVLDPAAPPADTCGHGTWVAGTAAAATDNSTGVSGVAWLARLMPVKVIDFVPAAGDCVGSEFDIDQGVLWAATHGARVINMSLGSCGNGCSPGSVAAADTMAAAWNQGCVLVGAAGNENSSGPSYPAAYQYVLGVAATDQADGRASFSNYGNYIDLAAPGVGIITTDALASNAYTDLTGPVAGTSFAAPIVSGLAAVLFGQDPGRSNEEVVRILEQTADHLGTGGAGTRNDQFGFGRVNMYRALTGQATPPPALADDGYAYPNPFSPAPDHDRFMTFVIKSPGGKAVAVEIFDAVGNSVWRKTLTAQETAGADLYYNSPMRWDGKDLRGRDMANGVYTAVITIGFNNDQ